jgi:hypothetical protein
MRGFVRRRVQTRGALERDVMARRVRLGADRTARGLSLAADVGLDAAHIVATERPRDGVAVRQGTAPTSDALRGSLLHRAAVLCWFMLARGTLYGYRALAAPLD